MTDYLDKNENCCRCGTEPHMKGVSYCRTCLRIVNNLPIERERPNVDRNNKTMCCGCKVKPRRKGSHYCVECANEMQRDWWRKNGKAYLDKGDNRKKHNARQFVRWKVQKGDLKKLPCAVCGNSDVEAHHHKGYDREHRLDVIWLCVDHHIEAEKKI